MEASADRAAPACPQATVTRAYDPQRPLEPPLNSERRQLGFQVCSCCWSACPGVFLGENKRAPGAGRVGEPLLSFGVLVCACLRLKFERDKWGHMYETDVQSQLQSPHGPCRTHGAGGSFTIWAGAGGAGTHPGCGLWYLLRAGCVQERTGPQEPARPPCQPSSLRPAS